MLLRSFEYPAGACNQVRFLTNADSRFGEGYDRARHDSRSSRRTASTTFASRENVDGFRDELTALMRVTAFNAHADASCLARHIPSRCPRCASDSFAFLASNRRWAQLRIRLNAVGTGERRSNKGERFLRGDAAARCSSSGEPRIAAAVRRKTPWTKRQPDAALWGMNYAASQREGDVCDESWTLAVFKSSCDGRRARSECGVRGLPVREPASPFGSDS